MRQSENGFLVLTTGEVFRGHWLGGEERAGEVVFNTSHSGYEEIATDPSYFQQILVMTSPMQGNYGAEKDVWESHRLWIQGFVCLEMMQSEREHSWLQRLRETKVPILEHVDTRALVRRLREGGTTWGALVQAPNEDLAKSRASELIADAQRGPKDWVYEVSRKKVEARAGLGKGAKRIAVVDFGCKENILRELQLRFSEVRVFPSRTSASELMNWKPQAILLSNGPGDPAEVQVAPQEIAQLLGQVPVFGICMGHQVLALSMGAKTFRLKFGHRGSNHPIRDEALSRVYVSSQNHGYAVVPESLPSDIQITHWNLNDKTVAGFISHSRKILGIQYHPESCPGPHDAVALFDYFVDRWCQ